MGIEQFSGIVAMLIIAVGVPATLMGLSFLFGPRNPTPQKGAPYESGIEEIHPMPRRSSVKFLRVAMLFLIFDVEALAFFPLAAVLKDYATNHAELAVYLFLEFLLFFGILILGYVYIWRKGALKWTI